MKNRLWLSFTFLLFTVSCLSQNDTVRIPGWKINHKKIFNKKTEALVVLDGFFVSKDLIEHLDNNEIESINIIKNQTPEVIYGKKGENGVILITSKNPSDEKIQKLLQLHPLEYKKNKTKKISFIIKVTDCEDMVLTNVLIQNLNSNKVYKIDKNGNSEIKAKINDVLLFNSEGFISQKVLVENSISKVIKLKVIQISEVKAIMVKKPVIYLYPEKITDVDFKFNFNGKLSTTFPKYDSNWSLIAYPDGKIYDKKTKRNYNSLFWDGFISPEILQTDTQTGFVVKKNNLTSFLIEKLEYMGLNTTETNDFIQFWLPILEKNELNFIQFDVNSDYDKISTNFVLPKPETNLRIFMKFHPLENYINITPQILPKTIRKGFTLVEWGGSEVGNFKNQL